MQRFVTTSEDMSQQMLRTYVRTRKIIEIDQSAHILLTIERQNACQGMRKKNPMAATRKSNRGVNCKTVKYVSFLGCLGTRNRFVQQNMV